MADSLVKNLQLLLHVAQAMSSFGLQHHTANRRQEQGRENSDNCNRHEQFHQRESAFATVHSLTSIRWTNDKANAFLFAVGRKRLYLSHRRTCHQRVTV